MKHVMVDLETLGTKAGCVILSIGAVEFDLSTHTLGEEFYCVINTPDSLENFMEVDPQTVAWWNNREPDARKVLQEAKEGGLPIAEACNDFNAWLKGVAPTKSLRLYGNGADFDNPILDALYQCAKVQPHYWAFGARCYRTLKNLHELFGDEFRFEKPDRQGTYHNALDDAKTQALHLMENLQRLRGKIQ